MPRGIVLALAMIGGMAACADEPLPIPPECNGAIELCERRFDEVAYPTTHNAMSSDQDGWVRPNQALGIARQLDDGIRGLMLDAHLYEGTPHLCHGICELGHTPLVDGLAIIRRFLDRHRGEVVTIIFESYLPADDIAASFEAADLLRYTHAQAPGDPWPTLRELIDDDHRLIVVTDAADDGAYPWYLDVWDHAWETDYAARDTTDFTCDPNRGDPTHPLFIFNHFLTRSFAVPDEAATTNANPLLIDRLRECQTASGHLPNFVTVDFYDTGDLFAAVATLNGLD